MSFNDLFAENLGMFQMSVSPSDIPDADTVYAAVNDVHTWWWGLDDRTRDILDHVDLAPGLRAAGVASAWPRLLDLIEGLPMGRFRDTINDLVASYWNAVERAKAEGAPAG
jgi:hypothetical protein